MPKIDLKKMTNSQIRELIKKGEVLLEKFGQPLSDEELRKAELTVKLLDRVESMGEDKTEKKLDAKDELDFEKKVDLIIKSKSNDEEDVNLLEIQKIIDKF